MTYAELRDALAEGLRLRGLPAADRLARHYLADARIRPPGARLDDEASAEAEASVAEAGERLAGGEPLQYVSGTAHFYGHELRVDSSVLIPRPETEELVRWVLEREPMGQVRFADLCTGSGCIAAALAHARERWRGLAVDVSPAAAEVAQENLRALGVGHSVRVEVHDILTDDGFLGSGGAWEVFVSNPPYIPASDWLRVDAAVAAYEPQLALRVPDDEPLIFYRRLARLALRHLVSGGRVYVECNDRYVRQVGELFTREGLTAIEVLTDMQGRPRHVRAVRPYPPDCLVPV